MQTSPTQHPEQHPATDPSNKPSESSEHSRANLLFFGEDWGRHPSTAQYLAGQLLDQFSVTWINSIGLREPTLTLADLNRVVGKVQRSFSQSEKTDTPEHDDRVKSAVVAPQHLVSPWVIPWHRFGAAQAINKATFKRQMAALSHLHAQPYSVITANPASYYLLDTLSPTSSLYYCADKYAQIAGLNPRLVDRFERELLERVDTVAATSQPLVDDLSKHHNNVHYLPHGVDFARFNSALDTVGSPERSVGSPERATETATIGFIGLLGEHIDFELIAKTADALSDAHFLFVGPVEQGITLPKRDNIEYLGQVDQSELPAHLKRMDVATLPYAMTERNHYANPTKVREYLAAGRAVVATRQPGLVDIEGEVSVTGTTQEYIDAIVARLKELAPANSAERHDQRTAIAAPMQNETWAERASALRALIKF